MTIAFLFVLLFVLMAFGAPIALSLGVSSLATILLFGGDSLATLAEKLFSGMEHYTLLAIPYFILASTFLSTGGVARRLINFAVNSVGWFPGGLAMASVLACMLFAAVSGSSPATVVAIGSIVIAGMVKSGYPQSFAAGVICNAGTLGILIPPSVALVIYAVTVEASIIQMFQAALIPGLIAVVFFMLVIAIQVRLKPELAPIPEPMAPHERKQALLRLIPVMAIFGAIILGLGAGLFTPTPAAGVGVFAILAYGMVMHWRGKDGLDLRGIKQALRDTSVTSSMIFFILLGAEVLKGFFSRAGLPAFMADAAAHSGLDPWLIMVLMLLALVVLGCFMESLSMIVVVIPFFWPALVNINGGDFATAATAAYGMGAEDLKIWFGILSLIVVELGLITPPVGLNVFIINALAEGVPMSQTFRGVMPFFAAEIIRISLIVFIPALTLLVPTLLGG